MCHPASRLLRACPTFVGGSLAVLLAYSGPVSAATSFQPLLWAGYDYTDNKNLAEGDETAVETYGGTATLGLDLTQFSERTSMLFRPQVKFTRYRGDDSQDTDDEFAFFSLRHKWETASVFFGADYERETTLTADLAHVGFPDQGADQPDQIDNGIVTRGRRETYYANPAFNWDITQRTKLGLDYTYLQVNYSNLPDTSRSDYTNQQATVSLDFAITEPSTIRIFGAWGLYEADVNNTQSDYYQAGVTYLVHFSEQSSLEITAAAEKSDTQTDDPLFAAQDTTNGILEARWRYLGERNRFQFYAGRDYQPSSSGSRTRRDQARFTFERQLTQRWTGMLGARWIISETEGHREFRARLWQGGGPTAVAYDADDIHRRHRALHISRP